MYGAVMCDLVDRAKKMQSKISDGTFISFENDRPSIC